MLLSRIFCGLIGACVWATLADSPSLAQTGGKITIAFTRTVSTGPFFVAKELGFFAAEGIEPHFTLFESATAVTIAVTSGDAEIGATAFTAGFFNVAGKGALKVIAATARGEPGFRFAAYVVSAKAHAGGFRSLRDFPGRTIGTTTVGSPHYYSLALLGVKYGFDPATVKTVPLQSFPNLVSALRGGQVDAVILPGNLVTAIEERGEGRVLGWVDDETPWQFSGIFAATRVITERRPAVERFVRAYRRGSRAFHDAVLVRDAAGKPASHPDRGRFLDIVATSIGQSRKQIEDTIIFLDPEGRLLVDDVYNQVAFWQSQGFVDKSVDPKDVVDLSFIDGHYRAAK